MTKLMAGMDLHSNNVMVAIVDQDGKRLVHRKLGCDLAEVAQFLDTDLEAVLSKEGV